MDWTNAPNPAEPLDRRLRSVGPARPDDERIEPDPTDEFARRQLDLFESLIELVGDADTLWSLDSEPLPDEPFDWSVVEPEDRQLVAAVVSLTDRCCDAVLDAEYRTIVRRLIARVASHDPRPLRRHPNAERCAAAFVWLAGQTHGGFLRRGRPYAGWVWSWFGVNNCSDRARTLYRAAAFAPDDPWAGYSDRFVFGDVAFLCSAHRADLIRRRDWLLDVAARRCTWSVEECDGRTAFVRVQARPSKPFTALKARLSDAGRGVVIVGFGDHYDDADYLSLTIPDAHDLVRMVQRALDDPLPQPTPS
jgi:hypothetical protein